MDRWQHIYMHMYVLVGNQARKWPFVMKNTIGRGCRGEEGRLVAFVSQILGHFRD